MKHLQTYENYISLNESLFNIDKDELQKMINKISKLLPFDKILSKSGDFKNFMKKFSLPSGYFNMSKVPFISLNENIFNDFNDWYSDEGENKILNILKKVFLFPTWLISFLIGEIYYSFADRDFLMGSLLVIIAAMVIGIFSVLGYYGYNYTDKLINGIDNGIVISETPNFVPAHTDLVPITISNGKTTTVVITPIFVPDTWYFEVKNSDRIEKWSTTDKSKLDDIEKGDTVNNDDYIWCDNIKK
jgi:hypothetical protein